MKYQKLFLTAFPVRLVHALIITSLLIADVAAQQKTVEKKSLTDQVTIRRTEYGVPHIMADNLKAAGFGLGYVQMEDYGGKVTDGLIRARGEWARYNEVNPDNLETVLDLDAANLRDYARAVETWHLLEKDTRDIMEGFAVGVNRYIELNPDEFKDWIQPFFTGYDVHARGIGSPGGSSIREFLNAFKRQTAKNDDTETAHTTVDRVADPSVNFGYAAAPNPGNHPEKQSAQSREAKNRNNTSFSAEGIKGSVHQADLPLQTVWARLAANTEDPHPDVGSNAWALAPDRTTSGNAILVRNPHLSWSAGYYEAHVTVPGILNFYGDFRVGGPLGIIGGFNERLGWATTNNNPDLDEVYALEVDPDRPDYFFLDEASLPVERETVTVTFKNGKGLGREHREFLSTPIGPVIHRGSGRIYVIRAAGDGEYRTGEQFLKMMKAKNLEEWKEAMRMRARTSSNLTYADADGNIFYVWNASIPDLPHESGRDTLAIPVSTTDQVWTDLADWDELPQLKNPGGGYLHNENDSFHFTNLNEIFDREDFPVYFPKPRFRLRSQHSHELIHNNQKFSLEDIVELKHSMRMLLADRVKDELVIAVRDAGISGEVAEAIKQLEQWDNTVARESRGGILFKTWWERYQDTADTMRAESTPESAGFSGTAERLFKEPWSLDRPAETPTGLADPGRAVEAFEWAVEKTKVRYGDWNLAWGDVHRARIGSKDVPVGGCGGVLGCFRVLWFSDHQDDEQKLEVRGGDGWVLAVEFSPGAPRAYSVLAYGQSIKEDSPYFDDQLEMFANNQMKRVAFTEEEIQQQLIHEYRPEKESE